MTSNQISPEAVARREAARQGGKFGVQAHTAPDADVLGNADAGLADRTGMIVALDGVTTPTGEEFTILEARADGDPVVYGDAHQQAYTLQVEHDGDRETVRLDYLYRPEHPETGRFSDADQLRSPAQPLVEALNSKTWMDHRGEGPDAEQDDRMYHATPDGVLACGGSLDDVAELMGDKLLLYRDEYREPGERERFNDMAFQALRAVDQRTFRDLDRPGALEGINARHRLVSELNPGTTDAELSAMKAHIHGDESHREIADFQKMLAIDGTNTARLVEAHREWSDQVQLSLSGSDMFDQQALDVASFQRRTLTRLLQGDAR